MNSFKYIEQAEEYFKLNEYLKAIECLDNVINTNDSIKEAYFLKGRCLESISKIKEAVEMYDRAIEKNHIGAHNIKGFLRSDKPDSRILFERALELNSNPMNAQDFFNKGDSLQGLGKHQEAINSYERAIQLNPNHADSYNNKGFNI
jgi:tetratricopeptide (TPR) repeat protein